MAAGAVGVGWEAEKGLDAGGKRSRMACAWAQGRAMANGAQLFCRDHRQSSLRSALLHPGKEKISTL